MAFNFPNGATNGQLHTADNGTVYVFNGIGWVVQAAINNYAITGSNTFIGDQIISGSINVSNGITGSTDFNTVQNKPTLISGSSQLTSSFDTIYEAVGRGIISSSEQFPSGTISGSSQIDISSITGFSSYSSSVDVRIIYEKERIDAILSGSTIDYDTLKEIVDLVNLGTGSYETVGRGIISSSNQLPNGLVSGSSQLTSSLNELYVLSGSITQTTWDNIENKPNNIVSSSEQISLFGFVSGSYETTGRGILSGSILDLLPNGVVSGSEQVLGGSGVWSGSTQLPSGVVSGSSQVLGGSGVYSSSAQIDGFETTGRGILSGSVSYTDLTNIPNGIISSSAQLENATITNLTITNLTTINETASVIYSSGSNQLGDQLSDTQILSGSVQIVGGLTINGIQVSTQSFVDLSSLNNFTASISTASLVTSINNLNTYTASQSTSSLVDRLNTIESVSGSWITESETGSFLTNLNGAISGSSQLTASYDTRYELQGRSIVSSSTQIVGLGFTTTSSFNAYTASAPLLSGNNTFTGTNVFSGSTYFSGSVIFEETREIIVLDTNFGLGTRNFDYNAGSTFYLNSLTGSGTWNIQNFVSSSQRVTPLTFVVEQGATPYSASAWQLGGTAVTVKWQNGNTPIGTANKTDVFGLVVFRSGSTFNVLGSYSTFG